MSWLVDETSLTANWTGQGVTQIRIEDKLALSHLATAVVGKAGDASEMPARKHHHWLLHPSTGKAGHLRGGSYVTNLFAWDPDHLF